MTDTGLLHVGGPDRRVEGTVESFDLDTMEGTVTTTDQSIRARFTNDDVISTGYSALAEGTPVSFALQREGEGARAVGVKGREGKILVNDLVWGVASKMGRRATMEDRHLTDVPVGPYMRLFAVLDGHGGNDCADYAALHLPDHLRTALGVVVGDTVEERVRGALHCAMVQTDRAFARATEGLEENTAADPPSSRAGTTVCAALIVGRGPGDFSVAVANAGDSGAVLGREHGAVWLTTEHKPGVQVERERIIQEGGRVIKVRGVDRVRKSDPALDDPHPRVQLSVSRGLGDVTFKDPPLVSPHPDVSYTVLGPSDRWLVMACDGVWDVMDENDVVSVCRMHGVDAQAAAEAIVSEAQHRGSGDNMTSLVVVLPGPLATGA
eukprot:comp19854_c0_seq1/m.23955 comp19854_c0_seq1/g.23955  ORF comp19854_c0_seq1/g.23955 comp19854_c0_seq1/m.23955 type:complete len:380 (-) comp19854_c0_seq1:19-1158(-)